MTHAAYKRSAYRVLIFSVAAASLGGLTLAIREYTLRLREASTSSQIRGQLSTIGLLISNYQDVHGISVFSVAVQTDRSWRHLLDEMLVSHSEAQVDGSTVAPSWLRDAGKDGSRGLTSFHAVEILANRNQEQSMGASDWVIVYTPQIKTNWMDNAYLNRHDLRKLVDALPRERSIHLVNEFGYVMSLSDGALVVYGDGIQHLPKIGQSR